MRLAKHSRNHWRLQSAHKRKVYMQALAQMDEEALAALAHDWDHHSRPNQKAPLEEWFAWLVMAGRGFGKTRLGAEWVREKVDNAQRHDYPVRIAMIAPTSADARDVMVEGESGLLNIFPPGETPLYEPSKRRVTFKGGSVATLFTAEEPNRLRGPQHHYAWADEFAAWQRAQEAWDMAMFGLRLMMPWGGPQILATTTPKPVPALVKLAKKKSTVITYGSTYDNKTNLAPSFFDAVIESYTGTRLGEQEVLGRLLLDVQGALWSSADIEKHRVAPAELPQLVRIVVAVDPAATSHSESAETGIIVVGLDQWNHVYVLEDCSCKGKPEKWAKEAVAAYLRWEADKIIGEVNNGGEMIESTIKAAVPDQKLVSYKAVRASRGKITRAEPVSALYERGMVHHAGLFEQLEKQMVEYSPALAGIPINNPEKPLFDRMDALVWGATELAVKDHHVATRSGMVNTKKARRR